MAGSHRSFPFTSATLASKAIRASPRRNTSVVQALASGEYSTSPSSRSHRVRTTRSADTSVAGQLLMCPNQRRKVLQFQTPRNRGIVQPSLHRSMKLRSTAKLDRHASAGFRAMKSPSEPVRKESRVPTSSLRSEFADHPAACRKCDPGVLASSYAAICAIAA